jgi:hypothetical protein
VQPVVQVMMQVVQQHIHCMQLTALKRSKLSMQVTGHQKRSNPDENSSMQGPPVWQTWL